MELLSEIKQYLNANKPLGIEDYTVSELGAGEYNVNYLVDSTDKKLVLRVSVSQLSGSKDQLRHEYEVLSYLHSQNIAPEPYSLDMNGFRYPVLIEEYIDGDPVTRLDETTLTQIGRAIATINNITITEPHPFEVRSIDYVRDITAQEQVLATIPVTNNNREWFAVTARYIAKARTSLGINNPDARTMLIRRDANPNNFIITQAGIKVVDWEITRVDDPTITLASFINEISSYDVLNAQPTDEDIEIVKRAFTTDCSIPDFEQLLSNRLILEQLGGLVWGLERDNNLRVNGPQGEDASKKLAWYNKVIQNSATALAKSLT